MGCALTRRLGLLDGLVLVSLREAFEISKRLTTVDVIDG